MVRGYVYGLALLAWLGGGGAGVLLSDRHAAERSPTPPVSGNAWGQHAPRPSTSDAGPIPGGAGGPFGSLRASLETPLTPQPGAPRVPASSFVDPRAVLWGDVRLGEGVLVAPFASVRADEGAPIHIGSESNLQDGVVIHGLPVRAQGQRIPPNTYEREGERYSVYVAERVSVEHQAQIHGPAWIEPDVWVGMQALVSGSRVGSGVVIEPGARVLGVHIPRARYVPAGVVVNRQAVADQLPEITASYPLRHRNRATLSASRILAQRYAHAAR